MSALKELDKIEGRANAATEGKWTVGRDGPFPEVRAGILRHRIDFSFAPGGRAQADVDAEFIAHAREDVPALVAALRAVLEVVGDADEYDAEERVAVRHAIESALGGA